MAEDDGGANPVGSSFQGARSRARGGSPNSRSWLSGRLEFDTKGVEEFTTKIKKAEVAVGNFVKQFSKLEKVLGKMPESKIKALGQIGTGVGSTSFVSTTGAANWDDLQTRLKGSERGPAPTTGTASGGDPSRRGQTTGRAGGIDGGQGFMGLYAASEIMGKFTGAFTQRMAAFENKGVLADQTNLAGMRASGGSYTRQHFARAGGWQNMMGATSYEDAQAAALSSNLMGGVGVRDRMNAGGFVNQMGQLNLMHPSYGGNAPAMQDYMQMATPSAMWQQLAFGIQPAMVGGKMRPTDEFLQDAILAASGKTGFGTGPGQLSAEQARITFGLGGSGRQNLPYMGLNMDQDAFAQIAVSSAQHRSVKKAFEAAEEDSLVKESFDVVQEQIRGDTAGAEKGRGALKWDLDLQEDLAGVTSKLKGQFSDLVPLLGRLGQVVDTLTGSMIAYSIVRGMGPGGAAGAGKVAGEAAKSAGWLGRAKGPLLGTLGKLAGPVAAAFAAKSTLNQDDSAFDLTSSFKNLWDNPKTSFDIKGAWEGISGWMGDGDQIGDESSERRPFTLDLPGGGREAGMDSVFHMSLARMFAEAPYDFTLTSGVRTPAEQQGLIDKYGLISEGGLAAPVGKSKHQVGLAADIGENYGELSGGAAKWLRDNASRYGLKVPMPSKEPWHVSKAGGASGQTYMGGETQSGGGSGGSGGGGVSASSIFRDSSMSVSALIDSLTKSPRYAASSGPGAGTGGGGGGSLTGRRYHGGIVSQQEAFDLAKAAGFTDDQARVMSAIAVGESTLDPNAYNPDSSTKDNSYGLWQINMFGDLGPARRNMLGLGSNDELFDPQTNARAAKAIFDSQGFNAWTVYSSGDYKQWMDPGIGDEVDPASMPSRAPSSNARGGSVSMNRSVNVQNLNLNVKVDKVSPDEAKRLARMTIEYLHTSDEINRMGAS